MYQRQDYIFFHILIGNIMRLFIVSLTGFAKQPA